MFLNSYRRSLGAAALMRGTVTEKRRFGGESGAVPFQLALLWSPVFSAQLYTVSMVRLRTET